MAHSHRLAVLAAHVAAPAPAPAPAPTLRGEPAAAGGVREDVIPPRRPRSDWSAEEEELRIDLAAAYRICAMLEWEDTINNHLVRPHPISPPPPCPLTTDV